MKPIFFTTSTDRSHVTSLDNGATLFECPPGEAPLGEKLRRFRKLEPSWTPVVPVSASWILAASAAVLFLSLLVWPINRDEGQYVAATALMRDALPYRDFAYLQTPLQPLLLAPLAWLPAGVLLVASRLFNGLCALATLLMLWMTGRTITGERSSAIALGALLLSEPFLFAASVARNDALPMLLLTAAILMLCKLIRSGWSNLALSFAAGLFMGLAISAKISAALPAAAAGLFLIHSAWRDHRRTVQWCIAGGIAGLLPCIVMAALAPRQFAFDVFTYSLTAPQQFLIATGHSFRLAPTHKILDLLRLGAQGSLIPAFVAAALDRKGGPIERLLDMMIVGGLIAAYLPDPSYAQYLVPLLPPLFVRLAPALSRLSGARQRIVVILICIGSFTGAVRITIDVVHSLRSDWQLGAAVEQGRTAAVLARGRRVVTLSPERVAGDDVSIDRGFVTGPFLFRTEGNLAAQSSTLGFSPNWEDVDSYLDKYPPAVVLTGAESKPLPPAYPDGLDADLSKWARSHGYQEMIMPDDGMTLYVEPGEDDRTPGRLRMKSSGVGKFRRSLLPV